MFRKKNPKSQLFIVLKTLTQHVHICVCMCIPTRTKSQVSTILMALADTEVYIQKSTEDVYHKDYV